MLPKRWITGYALSTFVDLIVELEERKEEGPPFDVRADRAAIPAAACLIDESRSVTFNIAPASPA